MEPGDAATPHRPQPRQLNIDVSPAPVGGGRGVTPTEATGTAKRVVVTAEWPGLCEREAEHEQKKTGHFYTTVC
jgi:hypothetical protein